MSAKLTFPRRRKLRIPRFRPRAKSSLTPLLLLSPPNPPDGWASAGAPIGGTYGVRLSYFFFILSSLFFSSASPARGGGSAYADPEGFPSSRRDTTTAPKGSDFTQPFGLNFTWRQPNFTHPSGGLHCPRQGAPHAHSHGDTSSVSRSGQSSA